MKDFIDFFPGGISASTTSGGFNFKGGRAVLLVAGTLAGTSNKLQVRAADGTTWTDVQSVATVGLQNAIDLPEGEYRFFLSGAAPTTLFSKLFKVPYGN